MTAMTRRIGGFIRGWWMMVRGVPHPLPIMAACLLLLPLFGALAAPPDDPGQKIALAGTIPGSGDGRIHILPTFSALSLKNGDRATIQAIVKAEAGVAGVEARIVRENGDGTPVAVVPLTPAPLNLGGVNEGATVGMWQTEWTAHDLEEAFYRVAITVTDRAGHTYTDTFLRFSDPIAGYDTPGTTAYPDGGMRRMDAVTLDPAETALRSAVIDPASGHAWFGTWTSPGRVVKVALGSGTNPPTRVGAVTLDAGEAHLYSAVIDPAGGHAWFGTYTSPGRVVKVALGAGSNPPTRVGAVTLQTGENILSIAVIDPAGGHAWFGTSTTPGRVVKVALGAGANPPTRVGAVALDAGEDYLYSAVIDPAGGHAWFGTGSSPGRVVKVALGAGSDPPTRVGAVTLDTGENSLSIAVIDPASGHAWFGTATAPARVVKVALGLEGDPPFRVGAMTLDTGENQLRSAVIDPASGHAWFGTYAHPGGVVKVALGAGANPPTRVGTVTLNYGEDDLRSAVIDPASGHAWFATITVPGQVVRVALSHKGFVKATRFNLPEDGVVESVSFYSHQAAGNVRLALYDTNTPRTVIWESGSIANTAANDWLTVPVAGGTPSSLALPAGDYSLAWQTDSAADVPSYAAGTADHGLIQPHTWGAFPPELTATTSTSDRWSAYITYDTSPPDAPSTPGATAISTDRITWTWQDNSDNETGFRVYAGAGASVPGTVTHTTAADVEAWEQTGLATNAQYTMQVSAYNYVGESAKTANHTAWTLAATPVAPVVSGPTANTLDVAVGAGDDNPAATEYAIYCSTTTQWVQSDGSLSASAVWQTAATWGTKTVTDLSGATTYAFQTRARNGASVQTADGPSASGSTHATLTYTAGANGSIVGSSPQVVPYGSDGAAVTAEPATGYHFVQWSDDEVLTATRQDLNVTANITVSASFAAISYAVTFDAQSGTPPSPASKSVTFASTYGALATTARTGYTFAGWWTGIGGSGTEVTAATEVATAENHTLYAYWTINEYTLTFDSAGGSTVGPITQDYGTAVTAPAAPTRTGYTFTGWYPEVPATMPAEDRTLTAQWTVNQYTLTFDSAGGSTVDPITQDYGTAVTAPADPTRAGYTFTGWNPVVPATMPSENQTLTAEWNRRGTLFLW